MKQLEHADLRHLTAVDGWLGLGDLASASDELEKITPENRAHPAVLAVRYEIYAKAKEWDMAAEVANALTRMTPESPASWICLAYSTRRKTDGGFSMAKEILLEAERKIPKECLFAYNLACYCSQLSQFEEAQTWLKKAMAIDKKTVKRIALHDPDLKPLWDSLGDTLWKREQFSCHGSSSSGLTAGHYADEIAINESQAVCHYYQGRRYIVAFGHFSALTDIQLDNRRWQRRVGECRWNKQRRAILGACGNGCRQKR